MVTSEAKSSVGVYLPNELWARIARVAKQQRRSKNQVIEMVLELHVPFVEDLPNEREDAPIAWSDDDA